MIEAQVNLIMESIKGLKRNHAKFIDLKPEVQREFNREIQEKTKPYRMAKRRMP